MGILDSLGKVLDGFFGNINAEKFRKNLILMTADTAVKKQVWPVLDQLGADRFKALIDKDEPFLSAIPTDQFPPKWQAWIAMAPQFKAWVADIPDGVLIAFLPPWLQELINRDERSTAWWMREVKWTRRQFDDGQPAPTPRRFVAAPVGTRRKFTVEAKNVERESTATQRKEPPGEHGGKPYIASDIGPAGVDPEVGEP